MEIQNIIRLTTDGMLLGLYLSLPIILVSAVVGLLITFLQTVTSLQDPSISHGVKLIAVTIALIITAPWAASSLLRFANQAMLTAFPQ